MVENENEGGSSVNHHREALVELVTHLGREIKVGKYDDRQRVVLGRCERWIQERLKRADDAGKAPRQVKRRRAKIEGDED